MLLHIKNMVCGRCIMVVRQQLENLGLQVLEISLGTVKISPDPTEGQLHLISSSLNVLGFELLTKEKNQLIERIKNVVIELVHHSDLISLNESIMNVVSKRLNKDQAYLSRLFSDSQGVTIERYIIQQKVERVKELLLYGELTLNEISYEMGYSSNAHLSNQFKSITGLTPSQFKGLNKQVRLSLDKV
ncbi:MULTISPECIES: helix-turn-helix domain-containing protein [Olivibacter]|uniref:Helix-turn-helix domain-containing protein n=1 Tax=Olivibacter oleidegradans TaxID=760123 RepID=A0ABV6HRF0_9SPHI|nr:MULTISPECIES: helix-turn-helix domain-containing protein [Olivibacter]QEL03959.1 helix-turn-helix domain-containing protein [Olivibacter sp. LS-1]